MGWMVDFQAMLSQRLAFTTLDKNYFAHALYLSVHSCDTMYNVQESKSELKLFYLLFIDFFVIHYIGPGA